MNETLRHMNDKKTLSVEETREYLGVSRSTIYELVNTKGFPSFRIGKKILVNTDALQEWITQNIRQRWEQE